MMRVLPFFPALSIAALAMGRWTTTLSTQAAAALGMTVKAPEPAAQGYNPRPLAAPMFYRAPGRGHSSGRLGARRKRRLRNQAARAA